jgi:imidazolonepropionase-like amidohydrolase
VSCVREWGFTVAESLPLFTANTARALALKSKGCLREGDDADEQVVDRETLAVTHVWAGGRALVQNGRQVTVAEES